MNTVRRFINNQSGATSIEYALIAALISIAIIAVATSVGTNVESKFNAVSTAVGG